MKKKITALCLCVALLAIAVVGASLAYFTDKDEAVNTFTAGNVDIKINETYEQNSKLLPGSTTVNNVEKVVKVQNVGSEKAFVRVHIAIPAALVDQEINAYNDMLHTNFTAVSAAPGKWSWHPTYTEGNGWTANGRANNNTYNVTINDVEYTVWVITYRTALAPNEETLEGAIFQVYLDKYVNATEKDGVVTYTKPFFTDRQGGTVDANKTMSYTVPKEGIQIKIIAEGVQSEGFENAYVALNEAFGTPGTTGYVSPFTK